MDSVKISNDALQKLYETIGSAPPEAGAVIGWHEDIVTKVWYDAPAGVGKSLYRPSSSMVESVVNDWINDGYKFAGIVHSHTEQYPQLSPMDLRSALWIMDENKMTYMLMGLFCKGTLTMYAIERSQIKEKPTLTKLALAVV